MDKEEAVEGAVELVTSETLVYLTQDGEMKIRGELPLVVFTADGEDLKMLTNLSLDGITFNGMISGVVRWSDARRGNK